MPSYSTVSLSYPIPLQLEETSTSLPEEIDVPAETRNLSDQTVSTEISESVTVPTASNASSAKVTTRRRREVRPPV